MGRMRMRHVEAVAAQVSPSLRHTCSLSFTINFFFLMCQFDWSTGSLVIVVIS